MLTLLRNSALATLLFAAAPACAQLAGGGNVCGSLEAAYGPYDYRLERNGRLHIVERFHFSARVEGLIGGDSGSVGDDLNYVLMTSPNHHRALMAVVRYGDKLKATLLPGMQYSIDCYFDRAIRYQPDDTVVRELYAQYLGKAGHTKEAEAQLEIASGYAKDNALSHFNIGLLYLDLRDYDQARAQAWLASEQGLPRTELADRLKALGKWQDPPAPTSSVASAATESASASAVTASP